MLDGPKSTILVVAAAAACGGFLAVLMTRTAFDQMAWCINSDDHCLRDWVGALSGWAAAIVGGATILTLYGQLIEQRRQTAFVLGNSNPTMDATIPTKTSENIVLRIVNWHRQSAVIRDVRVRTPGVALTKRTKLIQTSEESIKGDLEDLSALNLLVRGWINRHEAPSTAKIFLDIAPRQASWLGDEIPVELQFEVDLLILAEVHRSVTLKAFMTVSSGQMTVSDWDDSHAALPSTQVEPSARR